MVSRKKIEKYITKMYKTDRLFGRDIYTPGYSKIVIDGYEKDLKEKGYAVISKYESSTGEAIAFDDNLKILSDEEWLEKIRRTK